MSAHLDSAQESHQLHDALVQPPEHQFHHDSSSLKQSTFSSPGQSKLSAGTANPTATIVSSFQEQKNWISSVLSAATAAGEEQIEFSFADDKHTADGCSACAPDFQSDYFGAPHSLPINVWSDQRQCLSIQSCCWKFYNTRLFRWLFRGGEYGSNDKEKSNHEQYPKVEPAQNFRCGLKMLQERGFVLFLVFLFILIFIVAAFPVFLRLANGISNARIDYSRIHTFRITCHGCKVQISNHIEHASYFQPCNTNLFFPLSGSHTPELASEDKECTGAPSFCNYAAGTCNLLVINRASVDFFSSAINFLSMEVVDNLLYPWPTIDLIIPHDWQGTLELINPTQTSSTTGLGRQPHPGPLIVLPFNSRSPWLNDLNLKTVSGVSIPSLRIVSRDVLSPVYFLGSRGGNFKSISVDAVTGLFVGRDMTFAKGSRVSISIPRGDVTLNTHNPISTDLLSLYSSTAPIVVNVVSATQISPTNSAFEITLDVLNARNLAPGDASLRLEAISPSPSIGECRIPVDGDEVYDFRGISTPSRIRFRCNPTFTEASPGESPFFYNMVLNYFGGSIPLPFIFQTNVDIISSVVRINNLFVKPSNSSVLPTPSALPNNLCAVGAQAASRLNTVTSSGFSPTSTFVNQPILLALSDIGLPSVQFACTAARSLCLGSHPYSDGSRPSPLTLLAKHKTPAGKFPTMFQPSTKFSFNNIIQHGGNYPDMSPEAKIADEDTKNLITLAKRVLNGTLDYLIINVFGAGANLPGFFIFTLNPVYTVLDPALIETLTFSLLPVSKTAINVRLSPGLCPDFSFHPHEAWTPATKRLSDIRTAQVYGLLNTALIQATSSPTGVPVDFSSHFISFRYRSANQIWATLFRLVDRATTTADTVMNFFLENPNGALSVSGQSTLLVILSLVFPVVTAFIVGLLAYFKLQKEVVELRSNFFLSSIEGSRLNSIDCFRELSLNAFALSKHVSKLAISAPIAANLQTRPTTNLLKFFKLLEIGSKYSPNEEGCQHWYVKQRIVKPSFMNSIRAFFLRIWRNFAEYLPDENYTPLFLADDQKSYMRLYFKQVNTQFTRGLMFPQYILDDFTKRELSPLEVQPLTATTQELLNMLQFPFFDGSQNHNTVKVVAPANSTKDSVVITVCVVSISDAFVSSLHQGVGASFQVADSKMPFPIEGNRNFIIRKVSHGKNNGEERHCQVELECLDRTAFVDFEKFTDGIELMMCIENPYSINDGTIDWFKHKNLFDYEKIKRLIGHVIDDNPSNFKETIGKNSNKQEMPELKKEEKPELKHRNETHLAFKKEFLLRFNPFAHRTLLVLAAIFFDSAEAYRSIVSSTGVEFFMDLLVVNGSANIKKWKKIGSISQIQNDSTLKKDDNSTHSSETNAATASPPNAANSMLQGTQAQQADVPATPDAQANSKVTRRIPRPKSLEETAEIRIDRGPPSNQTERTDHVVVKLSNPESLRAGDEGLFFSIHSTATQRPQSYYDYDLSSAETKLSCCCPYKSVPLKEKTDPFKPGDVYFTRVRPEGETTIIGEKHYLHNQLQNPYLQPALTTDKRNTLTTRDASREQYYSEALCSVAPVSSSSFLRYIDNLNNGDETAVRNDMFASQLLSYYRPKGRWALLSPFLHVALIICCVVPTLALFTLWGLKQFDYYYFAITQTVAFIFLIICFYFVGGGMIYLLLVYLDFPYLFYGRKCCNRNGFGHFFFTPVTGVWYPTLRRLFNLVSAFILLSNFASIFLVLMWIALGVVVNPTLAVPYATGIVVFFTNFINVKNSLMNWQQLVVDEVLQLLSPFLNSLLENQTMLNGIRSTIVSVLDSVANSDASKDASDTSNTKQLLDVLLKLKSNLTSTDSNVSKPILRKLKEAEISVLLRSLWHSTREELGLSTRNVFIAVISSSLVLGLLLMFIFVGVSVFAETNDPFATIVNSLLTVGAGLGVNSNVDKGESTSESSAFHKRVVEEFCILFQGRLKNSSAILVKILALATCHEEDAANILQCILQASNKFQDGPVDADRNTTDPSDNAKTSVSVSDPMSSSN